MPAKPAIVEREWILDRSTEMIASILQRMIRHLADADLVAAAQLERDLALQISTSQAIADVMGRRRTLLEVRSAGAAKGNDRGTSRSYAAPSGPTPIFDLPFTEALDNLVGRNPVLAHSAEEVRRVYSVETNFAMAKSTRLNVTKRVQQVIARGMASGDRPSATELIDLNTGLYGGDEFLLNPSVVVNHAEHYSCAVLRQSPPPVICRRVRPKIERLTGGVPIINPRVIVVHHQQIEQPLA